MPYRQASPLVPFRRRAVHRGGGQGGRPGVHKLKSASNFAEAGGWPDRRGEDWFYLGFALLRGLGATPVARDGSRGGGLILPGMIEPPPIGHIRRRPQRRR